MSINSPEQRKTKQLKSVLEAIRNRLSFSAETPATQITGMPSSNVAVDATQPLTTVRKAPRSQLRVLRPGYNSPRDFDPRAKAPSFGPGDLAGRNLFELFDDAFQLMTAGTSS